MVFNQQKIIWKLILAVQLVLLLTGCQEDFFQVTEPDETIAFKSNDTIGDLVLKVTLKDGSFDNFIDKCSETSVEFPYSVQVKNEVVEINTMEDLEAFSQAQSQARQAVKLNYPVTVSFSDYSTAVLSNRGELERLQNRYRHRIKDDDIEAIDFVYPLEINLYDTEFQKPEARLAGDDKEMHGILKGKAERIIEIGYPVVLEKFDGTSVEVNDNAALQRAIQEVMGSYDENDEVEFDD